MSESSYSPLQALPEQEWECVVVGGGAAGLSAGLVLGRARRRVLVLDAGEPLNGPAPHLHGFLTRDGTPPLELLRLGRQELATYDVPVVAARVAAVAGSAAGDGRPRFEVTLEDGRRLRAQRLILAHGMRLLLPDLPGLREVWGGDAATCPYCHGWEVRDRPLAVLGVPAAPGAPEPPGMPGDGARAAHLGVLLTQWSPDVIVFPNGAAIDPAGFTRLAARGVRVDPRPVLRLKVGDGALAGVVLGPEEDVVPRAALFVAAASAPHPALLTQLGATLLPSGWPEIDPTGKTSVPGVWAAGQAAGPMSGQVINAAAAGSLAGAAVNADLLEEALAVAPPAAAPTAPDQRRSHEMHGDGGGAGHGHGHGHGVLDPARTERLLGEQRRASLPPEPTLRAAGVVPGQTVVDLGCGPGYFTLPAAALVGPRGTVYGVDAEPEMVEACRRRAADAGAQHVRVIRSHGEHVPLPDAIADLVLIAWVLHEVQDRVAFLRQARRLLKPGGGAALIEFRKQDGLWGPPMEVRLSEAEVAAVAGAAGLRVREQHGLDDGHLLYLLAT
jgi:thioredoxin reductase/predicted methyltransferase